MTRYVDPEKPPFRVSWVLMGSRVVSSSAKLAWMRQWPLDNSEKGCFASPELLGALIGVSGETAGELRTFLRKVGLLVRGPAGWKVRFPAECIPSERPSFEELHRLRDQLDGLLTVRVSTSPGENSGSHPVKSPVAPSPIAGTIAGGASSREGGRGESSSHRNGQNDQQLALSSLVISVEDGGQSEKPPVNLEQQTGRTDVQSGSMQGAQDPEWVAQKEQARRARGRIA